MASIQYRDGKWLARVRKAGFRSTSKTFATKRLAKTWARSQEHKIETGVAGLPDKTTTLAGLLIRYQKTITVHKKSKRDESRRIDCLLKASLAPLTLAELTPSRISAYRDQRLSCGARTTHYDLTIMRHCLEVARREWGVTIAENPFDRVKKPRLARGRERRLKEGEYEALMEALSGSLSNYLKPAIDIALGTAMRQSEILNLSWENVCLEKRLIRVTHTKNDTNRTIPMMNDVFNIFNSLKNNHKTVLQVNSSPFRQSWRRLTRRAGIEDLHFHDLRHEAISRFFEIGLTPPEVASISGHKTLAQLMRYSHANKSLLTEKLHAL